MFLKSKLKKKRLCECCNNDLVEKKIKLPNFSHFKFTKLKNNSAFCICNKCNIISNKYLREKNINFFSTKNYTKIDTNQKNFNYNKENSKHDDQFIFLKKNNLLTKNVKVLDIGCNKAYLISKINKNIKNSFVYGYEKNPYFKKFLKEKNFFYNYKNNKKIKFDLIIFSHSLMYFKDINQIIKKILNNLSDNGRIFIESPNIESSPFYLLMGDQYYFFSPYSLCKIFAKYNLFTEIFEISKNKSNFLIIFSKNKNKKFKFKKLNLNYSLRYLLSIKKFLCQLKFKQLTIFGCTVKAAFLYYYIKDKVNFFVDENVNNKTFYNLNVKHPKLLLKSNLILVPLKEKKNILKKLKTKYLGTFKVI